MTTRVNPMACRGYGVCADIAPDQFTLDDWGLAQSTGAEVDPDDVANTQKAIDVCPYRAIRWTHQHE
ncbi:ferredoxin [Rhodococcus sp. JT-3]|uniref:ferredoxin n=1 Tax=Rhodococcus sp. JT-3 TaxID=1973213 RepID=UPI001303E713|nr:ferredoxin [Rhodococcus sp. JT-3]